jgi:hypothetical protein
VASIVSGRINERMDDETNAEIKDEADPFDSLGC